MKIQKATLRVAFCDPDAIRTRDRLLRRQMLYPAELPDLRSNGSAMRHSRCIISPD